MTRRLKVLGLATLLMGLWTGAGSASPGPTVTLDARPLGQQATQTQLPLRRYDPNDPLEWGQPASRRVALGPQDPNRQEAALTVYPVTGLLAANPGEPGARLRTALTHLRTLLKTRPARPAGELPYLLEPNAAQLFATQVRYLGFAGGAGLRYLTMYSSDVSPVTGDRVFYTFQGLTDDGKDLVVLTYPVSSRLLPATYDAVPQAQREALAQGTGYTAYLARTVRTLGEARPTDFSPGLDALDAVVGSVRVKP